MPRVRHHRRRHLGAILAAGTAIGLGIGVYVGQHTAVTPPAGGPSTTLANEFVDTTAGSNPRRIATASTFTDPAGCNSTCAYGGAVSTLFQSAYSAASCGDNVLIRNGAYRSQNIPYTVAKTCADTAGCREANTFQDGSTSTQDYASCVTFQPESGATVTTNVTGAASTNLSIGIEVPYVRMIGFGTLLDTVTTGPYPVIRVGTNQSRSIAACSSWNVHDVILKNMTGSHVSFYSTSYAELEGSTIGTSYATSNNAPFINRGCSQSGVTHPNHSILDGDTIGPLIQDGSQTTFHDECIHWEDGTFGIIKNTKFKNCAQQPISIEMELVANASGDNMLIENNVLGPACETNPFGFCSPIGSLTISCQNTGDSLQNMTVRFNSIDGTALSTGGAATAPSLGNVTNTCTAVGPFGFVGNMWPGNCQLPVGGVTATVTYSYNIVGGSTCPNTGGNSGNLTSQTIQPFYVSPLASSYDYSLASGGSSPNGFVPSAQGCPATNILGAVRSGSTCNAGAY